MELVILKIKHVIGVYGFQCLKGILGGNVFMHTIMCNDD